MSPRWTRCWTSDGGDVIPDVSPQPPPPRRSRKSGSESICNHPRRDMPLDQLLSVRQVAPARLFTLSATSVIQYVPISRRRASAFTPVFCACSWLDASSPSSRLSRPPVQRPCNIISPYLWFIFLCSCVCICIFFAHTLTLVHVYAPRVALRLKKLPRCSSKSDKTTVADRISVQVTKIKRIMRLNSKDEKLQFPTMIRCVVTFIFESI